MRVVKVFGRYFVEDEPLRLKGKAAKKFLVNINAGPADTEERRRFLAECDAIYTKRRYT